MRPITLIASLLVAASSAVAIASTPPRILFVRGGAGTGGFLGGGSDAHLSDVFDFSLGAGNTGWGQLGALLVAEGFVVNQIVEGASGGGVPVPLLTMDLALFDVIVFGSNNALYDSLAADRVEQYVCAGGGVLFISDANFGSNWDDAPTSDQKFLDRFDLAMNQDGGQYSVSRAAGDFVINGVDQGQHPVLAGADGVVGTSDDVDTFDGEGVSPATVKHLLFGAEPIVLAKAKGLVHRNDAAGNGSFSPATADDGALVVAQFGSGRVACHFDRNTFFNLGGAGTSIHNFDNAQLAKNLFAWLAGPIGPTYGDGCAGAGLFTPALTFVGCAKPGASVDLAIYDASGGSVAFFVVGLGPAQVPMGAGCSLLAFPLLPAVIGPLPLSGGGPGSGALSITATIPALAPSGSAYVQAFVVDATSPTGFAATNGFIVTIP
jgi:hypothetical protein